MTLQRAFESCGRPAQIDQRAEHRAVIREQMGPCFCCGVSLALHFDKRNHKLDCGDPRVQAARVESVLRHALEGTPRDVRPSRARTGEGKRKPRRTR